MRREYPLRLILNRRTVRRVLIDPHYEIRHAGSMTDDLILDLVRLLDGEVREAEAVTAFGYEVIRVDPIFLDGKAYRLIVALPPKNGEDADCLGVINAFRVNDRRNRKEG